MTIQPALPTIITQPTTIGPVPPAPPPPTRLPLSYKVATGVVKGGALTVNANTPLVVQDTDFSLTSRAVAVLALQNANQIRIKDCTVDNGSLFDAALGGVTDVTIEGGGNPQFPTNVFGLIYLGGRSPAEVNKNIVIRDVTSVGSVNEHCLRVHNTEDLQVYDTNFKNPRGLNSSKSGRATYNLRDGKRFSVMGTKPMLNDQGCPQPSDPASKLCTIDNQVIFAPLADNDGGKNDYLRAVGKLVDNPKTSNKAYSKSEKEKFYAEYQRKIRLSLEQVEFSNFWTPKSAGAYFIFEAGLVGCKVCNGLITVEGGGGYCFSFQDDYGIDWKAPTVRNRPTDIYLKNLWITLPEKGGNVFGGRARNLKVDNCWYRNGFNDIFKPVTPDMVKPHNL